MSDSKIHSFHDLKIWQLSHNFVLKIYKIVESFDKTEKFRLTDQLIRAATSIPKNNAEDMGRHSTKDFIKFLTISRGSTEECKYLIILAKDLKFIDENCFEDLTETLENIGKM